MKLYFGCRHTLCSEQDDFCKRSCIICTHIEKFIMTRRKTQQQTTSTTNKSVRYSCTTLYSTLVINMQRHNVASDLAFRNLLLLYSTDLTSAGNYVLLKVTAI